MKQKLLFFFLFLFCLSTARAAVYYVDGTGGNNANTGTGGWADAKQDIQAAINAAASGDEIWVKAGTYLPTLDPNGGTSQRDKTFYITTKDVKLYGGFAGTETALSQRNPVTNVTTLSGNLDAVGNNDAYHVLVTLNRTSACVVDGFTISGGRTASSGYLTVNSPAAIVYSDCGGGMYNRGSSPTVSGCIFSSNTAFDGGGGMYNIFGSNPTVSDCVFSANVVSYNNGGGMYNNNNSSPVVSSCTFSANTANRYGGGMYYSDNSGGSITNCILYGNTVSASGRGIYKGGAITTLTVSYSLIENYIATSNYISGAGILTANPMFVNSASPAGADGLWRTADDGLRIGCASPARDAGTGTTPATDISGNARVGAMDMGAYENPGTGCPLYVDGAGGNNANTGTSWATAKKDIQAAINAATAGDEIWVMAGTYLPTLDPNGNAAPTDPRDKTFYITTKDVKLYGGFAGTETLLSQRNAATNITTLSGDLDGAGGTADAYHVLLTVDRTSACLIDGFTITGGRADGAGGFSVGSPARTVNQNNGGGMNNANSSPSVSSCTFSSNMASSLGGGMYNENGSSPSVSGCAFTSNTASNSGGGMYNIFSSSPSVSNCTFSANTAVYGGGMYNIFSSPIVSNCTFAANSASSLGGGMHTNNSNPSISGCTFSTNTASSGGGMYNENSSPATSSCVFSSNNANVYGGGMYNNSSSPAVSGCTFSTNVAGGFGGGMFNINSSSPAVSSSMFSANTAYNGGGMFNINSSPVVHSATFSANTATSSGGGMYNNSASGGSLTNCVLYGNTGGPANRQNLYKEGTAATLTVSYSLIGDYSAGATNNYTASNVLAADPLFVDAANPAGTDGVFGTADDGLALQGCSPAINAGTGTTPATDISGNGRVGAMDLGAYEYQSSPAALVLASAPATTDSRDIQKGSIVSLGGCGAAIAEVLSEGAAPVEGIISATMYVHPAAPSANQTKYARRHYDISTVLFPSTATARITLYFTQADFDDYNTAIQGSGLPPLPIDAADVANNKANLRITQEHGTSSTGLPNSYSGWAGSGPKKVLITPTVSWSPLLSLWKVQFPVTGFSGFFVTSAISTPLPLELLHFSAKHVGEDRNQLDWATGEEEGGSVFVVERSGDARSFAAIGVVSGKGSGSAYRFEDKQPLTGDNYYRLQVKEAGKSSYSQTVLVKGSDVTTTAVALRPNPATDRVVIRCNNAALEGSRASVWSARGRLIKTFVLEKETVLDVSEWTAGVYLLRLADGSTLRLVKQ